MIEQRRPCRRYNGVTVWNPQAKLIGRIRLPEVGANVCFGGPKRNWLFVAASQSLYAFYVNTQGRPRVNFRTPPGSRLVTSNLETRLRFELGDEGRILVVDLTLALNRLI